jgi:hypothetical protein
VEDLCSVDGSGVLSASGVIALIGPTIYRNHACLVLPEALQHAVVSQICFQLSAESHVITELRTYILDILSDELSENNNTLTHHFSNCLYAFWSCLHSFQNTWLTPPRNPTVMSPATLYNPLATIPSRQDHETVFQQIYNNHEAWEAQNHTASVYDVSDLFSKSSNDFDHFPQPVTSTHDAHRYTWDSPVYTRLTCTHEALLYTRGLLVHTRLTCTYEAHLYIRGSPVHTRLTCTHEAHLSVFNMPKAEWTADTRYSCINI